MLMSVLWLAMVAVSILYGAAAGTLPAVSAAVTEGAGTAVTLVLGLSGTMALWCGLLEVLRLSGVLEGLQRLLRPLLRKVYPNTFANNPDAASALSANFCANLLGLGSAATPAGLKAAKEIAAGSDGRAGDELCRLVVMNTASVQLLPVTAAAVRGSLGCDNPFDILPCVWLASLISVSVGLAAARMMQGISDKA